MTASKGIRKTNAVTGKQVNTAISGIFASLYAIRSLAKDGYTGRLMTDGRLETYLDDDLVWTSYFVGEDYAEMEFSATVDLMTGEMYA